MNCTVTGWGHVRTAVPLPPPKTLQQLEVPLLSQRQCQCLYQRAQGARGAPQGGTGGPPGHGGQRGAGHARGGHALRRLPTGTARRLPG
ncbi:prostasin-like isoform X2 [Manacus candei]|uniref:prostasin-like isoform X1 n=1 Tax=Manacus candei TaxID=415023 RepID=UPI0022275723|nr:prostasin-like isoform X1 [Manacus candei]XP_051632043.1 prostasin-like isoform X2 [Manacus candei]